MNESEKKTDMLHRITLTGQREPENCSAPFTFSFVYGIGSAGLTHFEYELAGKKCGDEIRISVPGDEIYQYFGHIMPMLPGLPDTGTEYSLNLKIERIEKVSPAELVGAISDMIGGCGCGGHGHSSTDCSGENCHNADCDLHARHSGIHPVLKNLS